MAHPVVERALDRLALRRVQSLEASREQLPALGRFAGIGRRWFGAGGRYLIKRAFIVEALAAFAIDCARSRERQQIRDRTAAHRVIAVALLPELEEDLGEQILRFDALAH